MEVNNGKEIWQLWWSCHTSGEEDCKYTFYNIYFIYFKTLFVLTKMTLKLITSLCFKTRWKKSWESGRIFSGNNDILVEVFGTPKYSGRVQAKGKHYTPRQYFHSMADRVMQEFVKESQERQSTFEANILAQLSQL